MGPVIGGLIVDGISWRWIFYVNVPICAIALLLAWRYMPSPRSAGRASAGRDRPGPAGPRPRPDRLRHVRGREPGRLRQRPRDRPTGDRRRCSWRFTVHALRTKSEPLIDLRVFRSARSRRLGQLMFLARLSIFGAMLLLPLYYQQVRGQSALDAGLLLAPQGLGTMLALPSSAGSPTGSDPARSCSSAWHSHTRNDPLHTSGHRHK